MTKKVVEISAEGDGHSGLQLAVDHRVCVGHGRCYALLPDLFEPNDEGLSVVTDLAAALPLEREQDAVVAVDCCPERAISVTRVRLGG